MADGESSVQVLCTLLSTKIEMLPPLGYPINWNWMRDQILTLEWEPNCSWKSCTI